MSDIQFKCPTCEKHLEIDESGAGLIVNCPQCGSSIEVPAKSNVPPKTPVTTQQQTAATAYQPERSPRETASVVTQSPPPLATGQELLFSSRICAGLLPGCVIASLIRGPVTLDTPKLNEEELQRANATRTEDLLIHFQNGNFLTVQQVRSLSLELDNFQRAAQHLLGKSRQRARWYAYDANADSVIVTELLGLNLMCKVIALTTPSWATFVKDGQGEIDLIELWMRMLTAFVIGIWAKFLPASASRRTAWGVQHIMGDCLSEDFNEILSPDRRIDYLDRLRQYESDDQALTEFFNGEELVKLLQARYEKANEIVRKGVYVVFQDLCDTAIGMKLQPICIHYVGESFEKLVWAFACIDGNVSTSDRRFAEHLLESVHLEATVYESRTKDAAGGG